ncbi:hypothetical protein KY284_017984 [Solanum tuberosum]|nr:hypothetical protein KY284_017984 [Solanum tuberosum]
MTECAMVAGRFDIPLASDCFNSIALQSTFFVVASPGTGFVSWLWGNSWSGDCCLSSVTCNKCKWKSSVGANFWTFRLHAFQEAIHHTSIESEAREILWFMEHLAWEEVLQCSKTPVESYSSCPAVSSNGEFSPSAEDWRKALDKVVPAVIVLRTNACQAFNTEAAGASYATGFVDFLYGLSSNTGNTGKMRPSSNVTKMISSDILTCKIDETDLQVCISAAPPVVLCNGVCIGPMLLELQNKQSMVLSGGYEDDEDHGEWFLYGGKYVLIIPS